MAWQHCSTNLPRLQHDHALGVPSSITTTPNQVSTEVRTLDSDMQMLIYENYNQFIAALDAIQGIRAKTQVMEDGMHDLQARIGMSPWWSLP